MISTKAPTLTDLLSWLEQWRGRGQVVHDDKQRCWHVLGHPEAAAVLSDPGAFSSDLHELVPDQEDFALFERGNFLRTDPPRHRKLRGLVNQAFTPRVVAALEPRIAQVTHELLDGAGGTRMDLIDRDERVFAGPNRFDIHRTHNPHLAFGHGIHFCVGAPLARLEARIALGIMFRRYADIAVAADEPVAEANPWLMVTVNRLPLDLR